MGKQTTQSRRASVGYKDILTRSIYYYNFHLYCWGFLLPVCTSEQILEHIFKKAPLNISRNPSEDMAKVLEPSYKLLNYLTFQHQNCLVQVEGGKYSGKGLLQKVG